MRIHAMVWVGGCVLSMAACGGRAELDMPGANGETALGAEGLNDFAARSGGASDDTDDIDDATSGSTGSGTDARSGSGSSGSGSTGGGLPGSGDVELPPCQGSCSGCDPDLGYCYIQCIGDWACLQADLVCPDDWPCVVLCDGRGACSQADVMCPEGLPCALQCKNSSCTQTHWQCEGSGCQLSCDGSRSCTQLRRN